MNDIVGHSLNDISNESLALSRKLHEVVIEAYTKDCDAPVNLNLIEVGIDLAKRSSRNLEDAIPLIKRSGQATDIALDHAKDVQFSARHYMSDIIHETMSFSGSLNAPQSPYNVGLTIGFNLFASGIKACIASAVMFFGGADVIPTAIIGGLTFTYFSVSTGIRDYRSRQHVFRTQKEEKENIESFFAELESRIEERKPIEGLAKKYG